ncbi:hypothetical protein [Variovorax sp. 22077]|uniref:hypothetical protein n=1 Tax=Variovorax sp. 22077 TaxID=3453867 RepID=UPI0010529B9C
MNKRFRFVQKAAAAVVAAGASVAALAADPATAQEGFSQASAASSGFGPGMWGLAAATVGILIGVKWIKRGRGAA